MKHFYDFIKISYIFGASLLIFMVISSIVFCIRHNTYLNLFIIIFITTVLLETATCIFLYYRNIMTEISFYKSKTILKTNGKNYHLLSENFYEVNELKSEEKILLKYKDNKFKRTFVYQKQGLSFSEYETILSQIKENISNASFK